MITTSSTRSPVARSASLASAPRISEETPAADHSRPPAWKRQSASPMWRLTSWATLSGSSREERLASLPTITSSPWNWTTLGVVGSPSMLRMTSGRPKRSTCEMQE